MTMHYKTVTPKLKNSVLFILAPLLTAAWGQEPESKTDSILERIEWTNIGVVSQALKIRPKDVNRKNTVENNLIHDIGQLYWGSPGIFVCQSGHNRIAYNELRELPYAGICVTGWIVWDASGKKECSQTMRWNEVKTGKDQWAYSGRASSWHQREIYLHARDNLVLRNDIHDIIKLRIAQPISLREVGLREPYRRKLKGH